MRDLLVTGTDTGVGTTVVAAGLVLALRERKVRVVGFKPAETGLEPGVLSDSEVLAAASGTREPQAEPLLRLEVPLAPAVAADRAGLRLDTAALATRVAKLRAGGYRVVVEGAGGIMVPLAWGYTALDLAAHCELTAVVVARPGLGTLNHTLLTVGALRERGVAVAGVVLNSRGDPPSLAESTNPESLARLLPSIPCVRLPRWPGLDALGAAWLAAPLVAPLLDGD
jgi:dethiobiotin synthetase